jgi:hypothetical protein
MSAARATMPARRASAAVPSSGGAMASEADLEAEEAGDFVMLRMLDGRAGLQLERDRLAQLKGDAAFETAIDVVIGLLGRKLLTIVGAAVPA